MSQDATIDLTYTQSIITDTTNFPTLSSSAKLNADTSWPELVDAFVQFLRGTGFYIDGEWLPQYEEHKALHVKAQQFYKEWEASRLTNSEVEVEHHIDFGGGDSPARRSKRKSSSKKKKKAKK